ncbi:MAG: FG-GAP-like repeat-containing protein [Phycisphaerales bacterium]|jgi:hypothetical protein
MFRLRPAVAALAVLPALVPAATAFGQGCDPSDLFETRVNYDAGDRARSVVMGDLDGDGDPDLAVANLGSNDFSVLLNSGHGTFAPEVRYAHSGNNGFAVTMGDLDGDGDADLMTANSTSDNVSVLLNNGDGTFARGVLYDAGDEPRSVAIGDLDGDGDVDLAVANYRGNSASVLLNNGDGTFVPRVDYGAGNGAWSMAVGDLDGDGDGDLITANDIGDSVSVLLNNGDGTFAPSVPYDVGNGPRSIAVGDLDGDGAADLVTANFVGDNASVLLNNGDGTFGARVEYDTPNGPEGVAIGDLNSDGVPDLATVNGQASSANRVSVLIGNGDGTFAPRTNYLVGAAPASVAMGDLNGDGALDLATANSNGDSVSVLLNRCVAPIITTQPASLLLPAGGGVAEFGVVAGGTSGFLYQWRRDGVDLVDGGGVSGSMTPTLTIDATIEDVAAYDVMVTNVAGDTVSQPGVLAVRPNPCPADFDGDGSLTLFDFLAFQNAFDAGCGG